MRGILLGSLEDLRHGSFDPPSSLYLVQVWPAMPGSPAMRTYGVGEAMVGGTETFHRSTLQSRLGPRHNSYTPSYHPSGVLSGITVGFDTPDGTSGVNLGCGVWSEPSGVNPSISQKDAPRAQLSIGGVFRA